MRRVHRASGIEIGPQRGQHFRRQILRARHRRGVGDQGIESLVVGCGDGAALGRGAQRGHIARGKIAPPGPRGRQNAADFSGPKMQQAMPGAKGEGIAETLGKRGRQGWCVRIRRQRRWPCGVSSGARKSVAAIDMRGILLGAIFARFCLRRFANRACWPHFGTCARDCYDWL